MPASRNRFTQVITVATIIVLSLTVWSSGASPAIAGDFPGQGNVGDWSQAIPYYNRGNRYLNQGRYVDAKNDFHTAISMYEFDPDFYTNLGVVYRKLDEYEHAEECYRKAASLNSEDWVIWGDLANACLKQNKLTETISNFRRAMKCNPPPPPAEKAAMLKDIADITKILQMQKPPAAVAAKTTHPAAKKPAVSKAAARSSNTGSTSAAVKPSQQPASVPTVAPAVDDKTLHDSGWDWTSK